MFQRHWSVEEKDHDSLFSVSDLIDQLSYNWPDSESWTVIDFSE